MDPGTDSYRAQDEGNALEGGGHRGGYGGYQVHGRGGYQGHGCGQVVSIVNHFIM